MCEHLKISSMEMTAPIVRNAIIKMTLCKRKQTSVENGFEPFSRSRRALTLSRLQLGKISREIAWGRKMTTSYIAQPLRFHDFFPQFFIASSKVHIFWEGHKILRNLHLTFKILSATIYTEKNVLVQWEKNSMTSVVEFKRTTSKALRCTFLKKIDPIRNRAPARPV